MNPIWSFCTKEYSGDALAWKWVSCTLRMFALHLFASFHIERHLVEWFRLLALMERHVIIMVNVPFGVGCCVLLNVVVGELGSGLRAWAV